MSILGKATKTVSDWKVVEGSEVKLGKDQLKRTKAVVYLSKFDDKKLVCRVQVDNEYADFTVDFRCGLKEGDKVKPSSIRVYDLYKDGTTITRLWGEAL